MVVALIRLLLFFFLLALGFALIVLILDWLLGHKLLIPIAKLLRFKIDDVTKTQKKVDEILGEPVAKSKKKAKKKPKKD